jgi:hypothetical protein
MNIESICSPYTDLASLTAALDGSAPAFKRGVFDMCAAFNLKADVVQRAAPSINDVWLITPNGWVAGRLMYAYEYSVGEKEWYFKYVSRAVKKSRSDARSDRNARAANKIKDLIKVLRMKKEMITDANAFEHEARALGYAMHRVQARMERHPKPKLVIEHDMVDSVARSVLEGIAFPEMLRMDAQRAYAQFMKERETYEEATASIKLFERGCTAVGLFEHATGKTHYFIGKVKFESNGRRNDHTVELQGEVKRYTSLDGTGLETDAAIIRTYMQGQAGRYDESNDFGLPRRDHYYNEIEVATGYAGDTMLWALLPERA